MISIRTITNFAREGSPPVRGIPAGTSHHPIQPERRPPASLPLPAAAGGGNGNGWDGPPAGGDDDSGDTIYGGEAIADYLFPNEPNRKRARRRVFAAWAYYKHQKEPKDRAGFFKFKGALCLSKRLWRKFHGRG